MLSKAFRHLLLGSATEKFLESVQTHEKPKVISNLPRLFGARQARWHEFLQDYNFELIQFPGKK